MKERIEEAISEHIAVNEAILKNEQLKATLERVCELGVLAFRAGKKILLCGNGGSAADAQHIAAELSGRFMQDRAPLDAEALHVNTSYLTAVANDYGYEEIYSRMVRAKGKDGDILFAFSTSGNSENIIRAVKVAKSLGLLVVGFTGEEGGRMARSCDLLLNVPSTDTARIQEAHILLGHIICEQIESAMFS